MLISASSLLISLLNKWDKIQKTRFFLNTNLIECIFKLFFIKIFISAALRLFNKLWIFMIATIVVHLQIFMLGIIRISICWHQSNMDYLCYVATIASKFEISIDTNELMLAFGFCLPNIPKHELKNVFISIVLKMATKLVAVHYWGHKNRYHRHNLYQRPKQAKVSLNPVTVLVKNVFWFLFLFFFLPLLILCQFLD